MDLVIKVEYGGLGDHLFFSHIPRIAKLGLQASSADNYGGGGGDTIEFLSTPLAPLGTMIIND